MKETLLYIAKEACGALMTISFMLCYVPQIIKIHRTKSSKDISPVMIFLGISGYVFGTLYMFLTQFGIWWFLNYTTGMITSLCLLVYYLLHRGDKEPKEVEESKTLIQENK